MDTLKIIRGKVEILLSMVPQDGLLAVVRHLEIAESHYFRAQKSNDNDLYTDVIYRTNHAFEGILKEAYALLAEKNPQNKQTQQIEKYLSENKVFKPRVMELFRQYRTEWRNPSTHEYQLLFTQQEAFLSILSVTSFVSILIDQMIEKAAFDSEKSVEKTEAKDEKEIKKLQQMPLLDKLSYLLPSFYRQMQERSPESIIQTERQFIGRLHAFINSSIPEIEIEVEPLLVYEGKRYTPDFVLSQGDKRIVLEVRGAKKVSRNIRGELEYMMLHLLRAAKAPSGIVFIYPTDSKNKNQRYDHIEVTHPDQEHILVYILPRTGEERHNLPPS